jgi:hypothetical protein
MDRVVDRAGLAEAGDAEGDVGFVNPMTSRMELIGVS